MELTIKINLDNAAHRYDGGDLIHEEVAKSIDVIQERISFGDIAGTIKDDNGNTIGKWAITRK